LARFFFKRYGLLVAISVMFGWFIGGYFGRVSGSLVAISVVFLVYLWLFQRAEGGGFLCLSRRVCASYLF
jgi:hypothetical protein